MISVIFRFDKAHLLLSILATYLVKIQFYVRKSKYRRNRNTPSYTDYWKDWVPYDNTTYIVPISYAYDGEFVYALTREGLKINIMRQNRQICFEVEDIPDLGNWKSVICLGEFEELPNKTERHQALILLHDRHLPHVTSATTKLSSTWPFRPSQY